MSDSSLSSPVFHDQIWKLGTRGSELALTQATMVEAALRLQSPGCHIDRQVIKTTGDVRTDIALRALSAATGGVVDKGVFIKELEMALEEGRIDFAVHSLKDVPSILDPKFTLAAVLPRAPIEDVLISKHPGGLEGLPEGAVVATGSVRRQRFLKWHRPDLSWTEIRGNVPTRLRKLWEDPNLDGILLARAGMVRLGWSFPDAGPWDSVPDSVFEAENKVEATLYTTVLPTSSFLPAGGQGAIALEILADRTDALTWLKQINHEETQLAVRLERKFLALLGAGCETPVGIHARVENHETLHAQAVVFAEGVGAENVPPRKAEVSGSILDPEGLAEALKQALA